MSGGEQVGTTYIPAAPRFQVHFRVQAPIRQPRGDNGFALLSCLFKAQAVSHVCSAEFPRSVRGIAGDAYRQFESIALRHFLSLVDRKITILAKSAAARACPQTLRKRRPARSGASGRTAVPLSPFATLPVRVGESAVCARAFWRPRPTTGCRIRRRELVSQTRAGAAARSSRPATRSA